MATCIREQAHKLALEQILVTMDNQNLEAFNSVHGLWTRFLDLDSVKEITQQALSRAKQKMDNESYQLLCKHLLASALK